MLYLCNIAQKNIPACNKLSFQNSSKEGIIEQVKKRKMEELEEWEMVGTEEPNSALACSSLLIKCYSLY